MSNTIINSNSNSALVSTLLESENAVVNPFIYAEKNIVPPHSVQIVSIPPLNTANIVANGTLDYDVPKQGVVRRMLLDCIFTKQVNADVCSPTNFLNAFESIELLSSGRRISLLTREGILAKISDLPYQQRQAYVNAFHMNAHDHLTAADKMAHRVVFPLDFFFTDSNKYALITNFLEPLRVRVKLSGLNFQIDNGTALKPPVASQVNLMLEYRELPNVFTDKLIEQNYGDGMLTQLINQLTYETPKTFTMTSTTSESQKIEVELKETGAVKSMYIICEVRSEGQQANPPTTAIQQGMDIPLPFVSVKLEAGGQVIMDVPAEYLQYWGRTCDDRTKYYTNASVGSNSATNKTDNHNIQFVYKIDFGMGKEDTSNVVSFRELSNKKLVVHLLRELDDADGFGHGFAGLQGKTATLQVIYETAQLMTTQSSTGRINLSLSN